MWVPGAVHGDGHVRMFGNGADGDDRQQEEAAAEEEEE